MDGLAPTLLRPASVSEVSLRDAFLGDAVLRETLLRGMRKRETDVLPGSGGILYIEDFDDTAPPPAPEPEIVAPSYNRGELDAAREGGRQAGLEEARIEHQTVQAQLRTATLAAIGDALATARADAGAVAQHMADELAATLLALLAAALPAAAQACAGSEIAALLAAILPPLSREPALLVRVHPAVAPDIEAIIARTWPAQATRITVTPDAALEAGDVAVTWAEGEAVRDTKSVWNDLRAALAPYGLPSLDALLKGTCHGQ
jgi:flagellar biosynthesis/type III secretory pathway protein FliH